MWVGPVWVTAPSAGEENTLSEGAYETPFLFLLCLCSSDISFCLQYPRVLWRLGDSKWNGWPFFVIHPRVGLFFCVQKVIAQPPGYTSMNWMERMSGFLARSTCPLAPPSLLSIDGPRRTVSPLRASDNPRCCSGIIFLLLSNCCLFLPVHISSTSPWGLTRKERLTWAS